MKSSAIDLMNLISQNSELGLIEEENLFVGREPPTPNDTVTLFDTPGGSPDLTFDKKSYERPSVQIRIRSIDYETGWSLAEKLKVLINGRANETLNNTFYALIMVSNGPFHLDWDNNDRARFIINVNLQRR